MFSFVGRGVCESPYPLQPNKHKLLQHADAREPVYIFVGCVIAGSSWYQYIPGGIVALIGLAYVALEFVPSIEPPANMRDADAGWGAEQV